MFVPSSSSFRRLLGASVLSQLGDWSTRLALAVLIFDMTGDERWVGLLAAAFVAPWLGPGQALTAWADRFGRQRVMVVCDLMRSAVFFAIASTTVSPTVLLALVLLAATIDPIFEANGSALIYDVLDDDERDEGLRLKLVWLQIAQIVAIGLAGVLVSFTSARWVIYLNAASFVASAVLVASTRVSDRAAGVDAEPSGVREALVAIVGHVHIRAALLTTMVTVFAAHAIEAQIAVLAAAPLAAWVLPVAGASIPAATALATAMAPTSGGTAFVLRRSLWLTTAAAVGAGAALEVGSGPAIVVAALCSGLMFQTSTSGQVVAFRHLPARGRASAINIAQTLVLLAFSLGGAVSGLAMSALGRTRGLQVLVLLALGAWLVPMPSDAGLPAPDDDESEI